MKKRNLLIGGAVLVALSVTHWLAYNLGGKHSLEDYAPLLVSERGRTPADDLPCQCDLLDAVVKCPDDFSKEDIQRWRDETEALLSMAETDTLDFCKKTGNEGAERRIRAMIHEAHGLLSKLPK